MRILLMEGIMATNTTAKKKSSAELLRERKIMELQDRVAQYQAGIAELETQRAALMHSSIVGISVVHKQYGAGTVIEQNANTFTVKFDLGDKRFVVPAAFANGFLETADGTVNQNVSEYLEIGRQIKEKKEEVAVCDRSIRILESKK